jgi:hypothetical protein
MVNYRSKTEKTVSVGRYQVTANPGVDLESADAELDALVASGQLVKDGGDVVVAPKPEAAATAVPGKSK